MGHIYATSAFSLSAYTYVLANDLLLEVFINLFRNAVNYSPEVKRIYVRIQATKGY